MFAIFSSASKWNKFSRLPLSHTYECYPFKSSRRILKCQYSYELIEVLEFVLRANMQSTRDSQPPFTCQQTHTHIFTHTGGDGIKLIWYGWVLCWTDKHIRMIPMEVKVNRAGRQTDRRPVEWSTARRILNNCVVLICTWQTVIFFFFLAFWNLTQRVHVNIPQPANVSPLALNFFFLFK